MHIETLKVFCDLAETESFTRSAQLNGVTQSSVSQQISSLERQLKVLLVERSKKKFRLTHEGELLYDYGKRLIALSDELQHRLDELKDVVSGSLRVATIYSVGLHELPSCLKKFLTECPAVKVQIEYHRFDQVHDAILDGSMDLGVVAFSKRDPRLEIVSLRRDEMILVTHPQHPFTKQGRIHVSSLHRTKFVGFAAGLPTRAAIDKVLRSHGVSVEYVMSFDNVELMKQAVEIDAGVAIVPKSTVTRELENKSLARIEVDGAEFMRPLAVIYRKDATVSPAMKHFINRLKSELGNSSNGDKPPSANRR